MWFKKEKKLPIEPIIKVDEISLLNDRLIEIHALHPEMTYVFWFRNILNPMHIQAIRNAMEKHKVKVMVITGINVPEIYEFKEVADAVS